MRTLSLPGSIKCLIFMHLILFTGLRVFSQNQARIDSLLQALPGTTGDSARFETYIKVFREYVQSDYERAMWYCDTAMQIANRSGNDYLLGKAFNSRGMLLRNKGELDDAIQAHETALTHFEKTGNQKGVADTYTLLGRSYGYKNDYEAALKNYLKAYALYEKINREEDLAACASNLGQLYSQLQDPEKAKAYIRKALEIAVKTDNKMGISVNTLNLGVIAFNEQKYPEAKRYSLEAVRLKTEIDDKRGLATAYLNLGGVAEETGDLKGAVYWNRKASDITQKLGDKILFYGAQINYARALNKTGHADDAAKIIETILAPLKQTGNMDLLAAAYDLLAEIKGKKEEYIGAISDLKSAQALKDSMISVEKNRQLLELQEKFEVNQKEARIRLLQKENLIKDQQVHQQQLWILFAASISLSLVVILILFVNRRKLQRRNESMRAEMRTQAELNQLRMRISRDIHDDIGSQLTRLLMLAGNAGNDPNLRLQGTLRDVIQNLGEIVWASNPEYDQLDLFLSYLRAYVSEYFENTTIQPELHFPETGTGIRLNPVVKRNLFMVIKEALNNCVKHSGASALKITWTQEKDRYLIEIQDDGKGIDPEGVQPWSNGLKNMQRRMEEIGGTFSRSSDGAPGTLIALSGSLIPPK